MDKYFWEQFRKGDEEAFNKIYLQYSDMLYSFGMKVVADSNLVRECIQDLFVYLYEKRRGISTPDNLQAYLLSSLRRLLYRRQNERSVYTEFEPEYQYSFDLLIDVQDTMERLDLEESRLAALQEALNMLSPQQREVIYLRYYRSMSVDEVSTIIGINKQTVMNVCCTALSRLRKNERLLEHLLFRVDF